VLSNVRDKMRAAVACTAILLLRYAAAAGLQDAPIVVDEVTYLDGLGWTASDGASTDIRATVPGDLISDLEAAGLVGDPWLDLTWRAESHLWDLRTWTYSRAFTAPRRGGAVWLMFDGVKLAANVSLNGVQLGEVTSQFVRYRFDVTTLLRAGPDANTLSVAFPPTPTDARNDAGRFMPCSGFWDWAPK
jgi:beta-mannosidase